jgi:putative ABC transport system substrate-binding protein
MGVADDAEGQGRVKGLQQGLQELGWIEGRNVRIDYRWTGGDATRVRTYVAELVKLSPDVIVAHTPTVIAAMRQASNSIPIVFRPPDFKAADVSTARNDHRLDRIAGKTIAGLRIVGGLPAHDTTSCCSS